MFSRKRDGSGLSLVAKGRDSWLGWVELIKERTNEVSIENTARVLNAVKADIVCTVEVDNRTALKNFNDLLLKDFSTAYQHTMLIDGNDDRILMWVYCPIMKLNQLLHILTMTILMQMAKNKKYSAGIALNSKLKSATKLIFTMQSFKKQRLRHTRCE